MEHILAASDFDRESLEELFSRANSLDSLRRTEPKKSRRIGKGKQIAMFFYEPSTRTELSFTVATRNIGAELVYHTTTAGTSSSAAKGEPIALSVHNVYKIAEPDVIIIRHPDDNAAEIAAKVASQYNTHVINAGSGKREHPTQMLLDLYTIKQHRPGHNIDGVKIVLGGDPFASRTIHSLAIALMDNYEISEMGVCGPPDSETPDCLRDTTKTHVIHFDSYEAALDWYPDFVYITRPQIERYLDKNLSRAKREKQIKEICKRFQFLRVDEALIERMEQIGCLVMHPQPIDGLHFNEYPPELINHPISLLLEQSANGVPIRMAAIEMLLA